jgi:hypothetical protein
LWGLKEILDWGEDFDYDFMVRKYGIRFQVGYGFFVYEKDF